MQDKGLVELWLASRSLEHVRALRNAVVENEAVTAQVTSRAEEVLRTASEAIRAATDCHDPAPAEERLALGRCVLQLLHNACLKAPELQYAIVGTCWQQLLACLRFPDEKLSNFAASVLLRLLESESAMLDPGVVAPLLHALRNNSDFAVLCLKRLIWNRSGLIATAYDDLDADDKLSLLDSVAELKSDGKLPSALTDKVVSLLKAQADVLFRGQETNSQELSRLLALVTDLTTSDACGLQQDKSLLISTVHLLKMVHESEKARTAETRDVAQHDEAVEGFKRNLVRLIGNLCWKNRENQDTIRELDGIPLILDCSAIDEKNPFITEWVVFAIRSLCENNEANQAVISSIDKTGRVLNLS